ncbi:hypothetical protein [Acanthopleuribacter pedis]|uniref:6-bladed beta-propeller n=1 Tax=Acanthopleuribacter pedis TaxID=442870 RepID=A0A8J7U680_9BACT|nr:hypothetical protein [Acanthopleuribacter pedis]MBO1320091.1 hypothetical protein [Acanthopleuribacter pedis]
MLLAMALFLWTTPQSHMIELEEQEGFQLVNLHNAQIAQDGSILLAAGKELRHWDGQGRLLRKITGGPGKVDFEMIMTFVWDANRGIYWIVDGFKSHFHFFDRDGNYLGSDYPYDPEDPAAKPTQYQRLNLVGSRVFAQDNSEMAARMPGRPTIFQLLEVEVTKDGVDLKKVGPTCYPVRPMLLSYNYSFKRHWLVQKGFSKNFFVVDELSTAILEYGPQPGQDISDGIVREVSRLPLTMEDWVGSKPPNQFVSLTSRRDQVNWMLSFSRLTGLYRLEQDFLVGYSIPSREGELGLLALQRVNRKGRRMGDKVIIDGILIGTHENRAMVLVTQNREPTGIKIYQF